MEEGAAAQPQAWAVGATCTSRCGPASGAAPKQPNKDHQHVRKTSGALAPSPGMELTLTRKPVKTREKSSRKFMAKEACPAVLLATARRGAGRSGVGLGEVSRIQNWNWYGDAAAGRQLGA